MFKRVVITIDNFNNNKSASENMVLLSRVEKAMNEAADFPFYVEFNIYIWLLFSNVHNNELYT